MPCVTIDVILSEFAVLDHPSGMWGCGGGATYQNQTKPKELYT